MVHGVIFISAISPLHNGAGEGLGLIDRPIMRERTTNFPIVQSSTIKGVLRDAYRGTLGDKEVEWFFGPMDDGSKHAGCVSFSDAALLAFPVRSLKGGFVWATSPIILHRFFRVVELAGLAAKLPELEKLLADSSVDSALTKVIINPSSKNLLLVPDVRGNGDDKILLEEFPRAVQTLDALAEFSSKLGNVVFPSQTGKETETKKPKENKFAEWLGKKLVILPEDMFRYFVTHATEVVPNIRIDPDTGTSTQGLRYSEYLPAETILYSLVSFEKPFAAEAKSQFGTAEDVRGHLLDKRPRRVIQIGGDETKGKGLVEFTFAVGDKNG